jgi:hypothetical protein
MNVTTVALPTRMHYAHPENGRTLCGLVGGAYADGTVQCGRCQQILDGVDTSRVRK